MIQVQRSQGDLQRLAAFTRRHRELVAQFAQLHSDVQRLTSDRQLQDIGLSIGDMQGDAFTMEFAGARIRCQRSTESTDNGVALGRMLFSELVDHPLEPSVAICSIAFRPDGHSPDVQLNGDQGDAYLPECMLEVALHVCMKVLRARNAAHQAVA